MSNPKSVQVRVRLSSATEGSAAQVALTTEEYTALKLYAHTLGYGDRGTSTLIRRLGELAAGPSEGYHDVHSLLTDAAKRSGLSLGAWLRLLVLRALGMTELPEQMARLATIPVVEGV
jgi:hypothetical protein